MKYLLSALHTCLPGFEYVLDYDVADFALTGERLMNYKTSPPTASISSKVCPTPKIAYYENMYSHLIRNCQQIAFMATRNIITLTSR